MLTLLFMPNPVSAFSLCQAFPVQDNNLALQSQSESLVWLPTSTFELYCVIAMA